MKKFFSILLMVLCLNINTVKASTPITSNILKEGVYEVNAITKVLGNVNAVQNVSTDNSIYFLLLDDKEAIIQTIKMNASSPKYSLHKLEPNYKIILVGKGAAFFSEL